MKVEDSSREKLVQELQQLQKYVTKLEEQVDEALQDNLQEEAQQLKNAYQQATIYAQELKGEFTGHRRAKAKLEQRAAQLALINDVAGKIASVLELDSVLDRAARLVHETFGYHQVALFLLDGTVVRLKAAASSDDSSFPPGYIQKLAEGVIGRVATGGEKFVANNIQVEESFISGQSSDTTIYSRLCLPVKMANQILGVLDIQSPKPNAFDENDVIAMEALTNQIAVAVENARLYEALQQELSERQQAEEALKKAHDELEQRVEARTAELRRSEERYRDLFDNANDLIQSVNTDGRFGYVNRSWLEAMGFAIDEVTNLKIEDILFPDEGTYYQNIYRQVQAGKKLVNERLVLMKRDGQKLVVEGNFTPYFEEGRFVACRGILRDINERERAEQALRESEEKYRTLIENSSEAIFVIYGGKFEVVNRRFEELFGITSEDANAPGFVFTNIIAPKGRGVLRKLTQESGGKQRVRPYYEFTALDRNGNEIEVELTVSYPPYKGGLATQGIIRDITERKRIEEEKQQAYQQVQQYAAELAGKIKEEQRLREIATILAEVVASVSLTLSTNELLTHILLKLQQLVPYDSAAVFLSKGDDLVIEATHGFETNIINQKYRFEQYVLFQEMQTQKSYILIEDTREDERYRPLLEDEKVRCWIGAPLLVAQNVVGYLTVDRHSPGAFTVEDANLVQAFAHQVAQTIHNAQLFAELNEAQAQLVQRERLAALGQMAATMAHELRNPLMAIRMGVEYFLHDVPEADPRQHGAILMQANMDRIDRIVENILFIARAPQPTLTPSHLQTVIENELASWTLTLNKKKIVCHTELTPDLPPLLLDTDQIGRALSNLIRNSVDVLKPGGELKLILHQENGSQIITIVDDGPGILSESLPRIFEPFFTTKSRGTGLGLAIVKQIVDYHQGKVNVWSKEGSGTKFTIILPQTRRG